MGTHLNLFEHVHRVYVRGRREKRLSELIAELLPPNVSCLDVGCGEGAVARAIMTRRPDVSISGVDVLERADTVIPTRVFDGRNLPDPDASYDGAMLIDVLHHADDARALLQEAVRISRRFVIIKDHLADGVLADATLRFMDHIGNRRFDVPLPFNFLKRAEWDGILNDLRLEPEEWLDSLHLYPWPFTLILDRRLHFIARLHKDKTQEHSH